MIKGDGGIYDTWGFLILVYCIDCDASNPDSEHRNKFLG